MKDGFPFLFRGRFAAGRFFLGFAFLVCGVAVAQNQLKNPSFENPIDPPGSSGTTNWTLVYAYGGPADFAIAERTTEACYPVNGGTWGACLRPCHWWFAHAYYTQTITNLTPGATYTLSGYMHAGYANNKLQVYLAMLGGSSRTTVVSNNATTTRTQYFLTNTASAGGRIEVRLGLNKQNMVSSVEDPKFVKCEGGTTIFH